MVASRLRALRAGGLISGVSLLAIIGLLVHETTAALRPVPSNFSEIHANISKAQVTERHGRALRVTYANDWNLHDTVRLHEMPQFLIQAFLEAEDQRYFEHCGPDWIARFRALGQNIVSMRAVSGASTITEQVVRMINPRPRTVWSRWLEGWEARQLESAQGKLEILEFYLNQVPYSANRRGVAQAAHYYFDRDLDTLSTAEMLALAVLVRAPSRMDLYSGDSPALVRSMRKVAERMVDNGYLTEVQQQQVLSQDFELKSPDLDIDASHFLEYVDRGGLPITEEIRTTLDGTLQASLQNVVDQRLESLAAKNVTNAALLAVNHHTGEILAWVVGGAQDRENFGRSINTVITPRQPGSALKPFLYALALEQGWTAATVINDAPLTEMVGFGLHSYSNYSHVFYGPLTLRNALGNSLNIPALRTIQYTGAANYLAFLHGFGFETLTNHPDFYGDGLALGNGEVTLLELVTAYAALANRGVYRPLIARAEDVGLPAKRRVVSAEVSSLLGNILSDPTARSLEFGRSSLLNFPVQTAVKTGTSSDYRDSWAVGFDDKYVVGVWMGNLNQTSTLGITGSTGPALVLRGAFGFLNRNQETNPLWLSPKLARQEICADTGASANSAESCHERSEYFVPGTAPDETDRAALSLAALDGAAAVEAAEIRFRQPTPGLRMAYDPRLPADAQAFEFVLQGVTDEDTVAWWVDDGPELQRAGARYLWQLSRGVHRVRAVVTQGGELIAQVPAVEFLVK